MTGDRRIARRTAVLARRRGLVAKRNVLIAARTALVASGAVLAGVFAFAAPASADVTVTPASATQGDAVRLAFRVTNDSRTATLTKVDVYLPQAAPIAEVWPISEPDWAPKLVMRTLSQPIEAIHGTQTTQVASQLTWLAAPGRATRPGGSTELSVEMGPLPQADQVAFTVVQTYSDGTTVRWADQPASGGAAPAHPAPVLKLQAGTPLAHQDHDGTAAEGDATDTSDSAPAGDGSGTDSGTLLALVISGLVVGLLAGAGVGGFLVVRARRAPALTLPAGAIDALSAGGIDAPDKAADPSDEDPAADTSESEPGTRADSSTGAGSPARAGKRADSSSAEAGDLVESVAGAGAGAGAGKQATGQQRAAAVPRK